MPASQNTGSFPEDPLSEHGLGGGISFAWDPALCAQLAPQFREDFIVVNKCDRLDDESQVEEVRQFVADNAERLLGVSDPAVMPVSAKDALAAKLRSEPLAASGFDALEDYVLSFLGGSSFSSSTANDRGGEGMRLKLGTPLQVATLLFDAAEGILASERRVAVAELDAATGVATAMEGYEAAMRADFAAQLDAVRACVLRATNRADDTRHVPHRRRGSRGRLRTVQNTHVKPAKPTAPHTALPSFCA